MFHHTSLHQSIYKKKKTKPFLFSILFSFFLAHFFFLRTQAEISSLITFLCSHKGKITWAGRNTFFFRSVAKQRTYFTLKVIDKHREQEKDKKCHSHCKIFIESRMLIYCLLSFFFVSWSLLPAEILDKKFHFSIFSWYSKTFTVIRSAL